MIALSLAHLLSTFHLPLRLILILFLAFSLFPFLIPLSASILSLPRPVPCFFSFSLSLFSPRHSFSPSLIRPPATPRRLWSWESRKSERRERCSRCPQRRHMMRAIQLGETGSLYAAPLVLSCEFLSSTYSRSPPWEI